MKMEKRFVSVAAGFLYVCGLLFALYVTSFAFNGHVSFRLTGLIICSMGVFVPTGIATMLLVTNTRMQDRRHLLVKIFILILLTFYSILIASMLFFSSFRMYTFNQGIDINNNANFIPFKTIGSYIKAYYNQTINTNSIYQNTFGNIFLFAPFGLALPCISQRLKSFWRYFVAMLALLVGVEAVQLLTGVGRCDIDDVILNMSGALLFYGIWKWSLMQRMLRKIYAIT